VNVVAGSVVGDSAEDNEAAQYDKAKGEGPAVGHKQQTEDESWNEERDLQAAEEVIERWRFDEGEDVGALEDGLGLVEGRDAGDGVCGELAHAAGLADSGSGEGDDIEVAAVVIARVGPVGDGARGWGRG
jgi:hypothetical protein